MLNVVLNGMSILFSIRHHTCGVPGILHPYRTFAFWHSKKLPLLLLFVILMYTNTTQVPHQLARLLLLNKINLNSHYRIKKSNKKEKRYSVAY